MGTLTRRNHRGAFGDMIDWLEAPWTVLRPVTSHPIRVEDLVQDGSYLVRAELPGVDADRDVEVTVANGILTISAERHEESSDKQHSEFHYGSFSRSVTLPANADEQHITASYGHGILEVTVPLAPPQPDQQARTIPVLQDQHIKPS